MTSAPDFDETINRVGTFSNKWDDMEAIFGVSPTDGIAMWVADMDFRPPQSVQAALDDLRAGGVYGYWGDDHEYLNAITWWMDNRHGWTVRPEWIFTTHGLVNGTAICVDAFTNPGDGIMLMTPVYHAFAKVIRAADRRVIECPLVNVDGRYEMDFDHWDTLIDETTKMILLCSPHNPGGQVWSATELTAVAEFARRHNLVLVSDEIHHDIVMPGHVHRPMATVTDYPVVMMTAPTKTFNIAGAHTGHVIIADPDLRAKFARRIAALGISPNSFGIAMTKAAYTPEGAAWVDAVVAYLDENRKIFDAGVNAIPGVRSMPLNATYLAWVDFSRTGLSAEEITSRVGGGAKIAANRGESFGTGGETHLRFNIATTRAQVEDAVARLTRAFGDLQ